MPDQVVESVVDEVISESLESNGGIESVIKASTDMIKTGTSSVANILRRVLSTSATTVSIGIVSMLVYSLYRNYKNRNGACHGLNGYDSPLAPYEALRNQFRHHFQEPDIGRAKRTKEEVEEVRIDSIM